jgi:hypothetical protein
MPFQLSPGVAVVEKDFSSIVPAVSSSAGAFAGPFSWGPIEDPVRVSSETELVARFGAPKDANFQSFFTAANFLAYTNSLFVSRTDAAQLSNAVSIQSGSVTGVTITEQGNYVQGTDNVTVTFSAPDIAGGTTATGTAVRETFTIDLVTYYRVTGVTIVNAGNGYTSAPTVTFSAPASGTQALGSSTVAIGGIKIKNVGEYLDSYNSGSQSVGPFAAKFAGSKGNGLRVVMVDSATWATAPQDIKNLFTGAPSTSAYAQSQGITNDEVHIAIFDTAKGQFSGVANSVLEKYSFVSKLADARRTDGSNNYYKSVLNSQSRYVWWMDHPGNVSEPASFNITSGGSINFVNNIAEADTITVTATTDDFAGLNAFKAFYDAAPDQATRRITIAGAGVVNGSYTVTDITATLTAGENPVIASYVISVIGLPASAATVTTATITSAVTAEWGQIADDVDTSETTAMSSLSDLVDSLLSGGKDDFESSPSDIQNAYAKFANADEYDISLIPLGNVSPTTAAFVVNNVAEVRKDCVVFMSPTTDGDPITSTGSTATDAIIAYRNATNISSSYAVIDSGCKYQYDRYNDAYRWVPLNGDIAGLCARTDYSADPWYSPGGFNRGQIKNVVKLAFNPGQGDRDVLYSAGVNPVVNFPGQGVILYGDKTMLARPSAFDRINVRRLFIVLEKAIAVAAKFQLFEFNDGFTRAQFKNLVEPFLRDVQGRRGVTDFRVKCDETNNTGEVIDRNEFIADIFIKPNRSINFITLNFVAARSSVSFEEIGA